MDRYGKAGLEERLIELETKLSFQEHLIQELNEALAGQQSKLSELQQVVEMLREQIRGSFQAEIRPVPEEDPPPHY